MKEYLLKSGRRGARSARLALLLAISAGLGAVACDGGNAFIGEGLETQPRIVSLDVPETVHAGDTIFVVANARATRGVQRIRIRVSGEVTRDTVITIDPAQSPARGTGIFVVPEGADAGTVEVRVTAEDPEGNESTEVVRTVGVLQGPRVRILLPEDGTQVRAGQGVQIQVRAIDLNGLIRLQVAATGAVEQTFAIDYNPAVDTARIDTLLILPAGATGNVTLVASARNTRDQTGTSDPVVLPIVEGTAEDTEAPSVSLEVVAGGRLELTDSVDVTVVARDNAGGSGVSRVGLAVIGINGPDTLLLRPRLTRTFSVPLTGEVRETMKFAVGAMGRHTGTGAELPFADSLALPDTVIFQVHAFAVDAQGNCAAAVLPTFQRLDCDGATMPGDTLAAGATGQRAEVVAVTGRTVRLPAGGRIADASVDSVRNRLYLSNLTRNQVEVLSMANLTFESSVRVGSEPWGLAQNLGGDTLFVANSNGTNISFVSLDGTPREDAARRLFTPNAVLYELVETNTNNRLTYTASFHDFSDRPMFIAQDSRGRLLYSTKPTSSAPQGTIRVVDEDPVPSASDDVPEVKILFDSNAIDGSQDTRIAIANIDSLRIVPDAGPGGSDAVILFDHVYGFPDQVISSGAQALGDAFESLVAQGSDIFFARGGWLPDQVGLSDTTFVSASADRRFVAFGEGARAPAGRIVIWHSEINGGQGGVSARENVVDLVSNASEVVNGVALNNDGALGVARGNNGAYFFTVDDQAGDLRLQGEFQQGLQDGGKGAAFHPDHTGARGSDCVDGGACTTVAFVGTARATIKAIDSFHFFELGEIHVRSNVVGPMRSSPPLPGDNAGLTCGGASPDPACVLVKLYAVTADEGVVIVNVRRGDLLIQ